MNKHTPTPWQAQPPLENEDGLAIIGLQLDEDGTPLFTPTNGLVAVTCQSPVEFDEGDYTRAAANAAFIVRACNSHDALLEALEALTEIVDDQLGGDFPEPLAKARAAIALAKVTDW